MPHAGLSINGNCSINFVLSHRICHIGIKITSFCLMGFHIMINDLKTLHLQQLVKQIST